MDMAVLGMARRVSSWPWLKFPEMLQRVLQEKKKHMLGWDDTTVRKNPGTSAYRGDAPPAPPSSEALPRAQRRTCTSGGQK
jgi:hypothetical protein